jgi:hypothetical protein
MVGISLATSVVATGFVEGVLGHSFTTAKDFEDRLQITLESTSASLASLQCQLTSLAQVALQNRRALDLITAGKGGTCFFLQKECCYYVNESGIVEQNVKKLTDLAEDLLKRPTKNTLTNLLNSPFLTWLLPFLGPLLMLVTLCTLLPHLLQFLRSQVNKISTQTFNQLLLQGYQPLIAQPEDTYGGSYQDPSQNACFNSSTPYAKMDGYYPPHGAQRTGSRLFMTCGYKGPSSTSRKRKSSFSEPGCTPS